MSGFPTLDDLAVAGRRVLVRADLNVPLKDGEVADATRIERVAPTIRELCDKRARVVVASHLGRPKGRAVDALSLRPIAPRLGEALGGKPVAFVADCVGPEAEAAAARLGEGAVLLLENLRFHPGEEANDRAFAGQLARLADLYVNDAFSAAHRAHASTEGIARLLPAAAGRLMQAELDALDRALEDPERPVVAIVGGAKVSTKLDVLGNLVRKVDTVVIGGAMANTFLHARGIPIGRSLAEADMAATARDILARARDAGCDIVLPSDAVVATGLAEGAETRTVPVEAVPDDMMILDIGPASLGALEERLRAAKTLLWNGPLGAFETPPFDAGTVAAARAAAALTHQGRLVSVAGGGDTVAALRHAGVLGDFTYVSTAGGAFLEWLEGKALPGVAALTSGKTGKES